MSQPQITVHLDGLSPDLVPTRPRKDRGWWRTEPRMANHAHHCLPLAMANSVGYEVKAPDYFTVTWSGDPQQDAVIVERGNLTVTPHAAPASFTVQPGFLPRTHRVGDFVWFKGLPNERRPFNVMEGLIEAWWNPGRFGLVCLFNQPGAITLQRGEPFAQMVLYRMEGGFATLDTEDLVPEETNVWHNRRYRADYHKDLDYYNGRHPDGRQEAIHVRSWRKVPD